MAGPPGEAVIEASISVSVVRTKLSDRLSGSLRRTKGLSRMDARTSVQYPLSGATHRSASAGERVTGMTVRASAQTISPRPGSPALLRHTNEPRTGSPSTSVENEPRFNCRFGDDRITIQSTLRRQPNQPRRPARASAQTNRLRRDSPVCFGKRTSHRKRSFALRCTARGSRRSSPSTSVVKGLRIYIPARAVTRRMQG